MKKFITENVWMLFKVIQKISVRIGTGIQALKQPVECVLSAGCMSRTRTLSPSLPKLMPKVLKGGA